MTFKDLTLFIINNLEGGYFHPEMLKDGRVTDPRYSTSGETMFGIDRLNGGSINTSDAGVQFWGLIDSANAKYTWRWNYFGGDLKDQLIGLVADMMQPVYSQYANSLLNADSINIMNKDDRLTFEFAYASWNGYTWFRYLANIFNNAIANGEKNYNNLSDLLVSARINSGNSLISQGGQKIQSIIYQLSPGYKKKG